MSTTIALARTATESTPFAHSTAYMLFKAILKKKDSPIVAINSSFKQLITLEEVKGKGEVSDVGLQDRKDITHTTGIRGCGEEKEGRQERKPPWMASMRTYSYCILADIKGAVNLKCALFSPFVSYK